MRGLVLAFDGRIHRTQPELHWFNLGRVVGPALLILFTVMTFHGWKLLSEDYGKDALEWNRVADQLIAAFERAIAATNSARPAIVFVTAPYPVSDANVTLLSRWHGVKMQGDGGYYLLSLEEEKEHALRDDFVLISQENMGYFPGAKIGLALLEWIKSSDDFELLTDSAFTNGHHAYLFRKFATSISAGPGDWIERKGLTLKVEAGDLARRPFLVFEGDANYQVLGGEPKPHAVLTTSAATPGLELPTQLKALGQRYEIVIDARMIAQQSGQQYSIHVTFDRYFVPKALGINEDTRELVIMMPAKIELQRTPPLEQ